MKGPRALAAITVAAYWFMLIAGLVLYTAIRLDAPSAVEPIWIGALAGSALGQGLALGRSRLALVLVAVLASMVFFGAHVPHGVDHTALWLSFVPAALCGYWSLGDRMALAAFWYPAMLWMLSILDHTGAPSRPDATGIVLLGGLAMAFVLYLRVRESRRVALWRTVAVVPLATSPRATILAEHPGLQLARGAWTLAVMALSFGATAWFAPQLWRGQALGGGAVHVAALAPPGVLPCCPSAGEVEAARTRVKEYFDLGRGHDQPPRQGIDCQPCVAPGALDTAPGESVALSSAPVDTYSGRDLGSPVVGGDPLEITAPPNVGYTPPGAPLPAAPTPPMPAAVPVPPTVPTPLPPRPPPIIVTKLALPPIPSRPVEAVATTPEAPPATAPAPAPAPAPVHPHAPPTSQGATPPSAGPYVPPAVPPSGPSIVAWVASLVAALLLFQLLVLALRPVRRLVTLRHLRRPYWNETVDQRVSNSWQLALVGLRDAGWRASEPEAPRAFARRVRVEGVESCATILERARHGLAIDAEDLRDMGASAQVAYTSARARIGAAARVVAWFRWPLS